MKLKAGKKREKKWKKNLPVIDKGLPLQSAPKKRSQFFTKQVDFQTKSFWKILKKFEEKFGRNKKTLTFALPIENGAAGKTAEAKIKRLKIFESWETIALLPGSHREETKKVSQSEINSIWHVN